MSWAPRDLEDELYDCFSSCTLLEPPPFFKTVTEKHIPDIIQKLDVAKKPVDEIPNEVCSGVEMSLTQSLRMYGIESSDKIPKSSSLTACISQNDFSDPKHPLILEERYFTMKINHPCSSNQANKTRALPRKSACNQQVNEPEDTTAKYNQDVLRPRSPMPGEEVKCPAVSKSPHIKSKASSKIRKRTKMKKFELTPQESPQKSNRMAPPGVRGICFV
ncbi:unnamed protein product [Diamesa hyperborea]